MFKKAARFQTETRARRNLSEREHHADQRQADDARETYAASNLTAKLPLDTSGGIEVLRGEFERMATAVEAGALPILMLEYFALLWNAGTAGDRLSFAHIKTRLIKRGVIAEAGRSIEVVRRKNA